MSSTANGRRRRGPPLFTVRRSVAEDMSAIYDHLTRADIAIESGVPFDISTADYVTCKTLLSLHRQCIEDVGRHGKLMCDRFEKKLMVSCPPSDELEDLSWSQVIGEVVNKIKLWGKNA